MAEIKNYPSNSIKSREKKQKPEVIPVLEEGDAKIRKPGLPRKIFNAFFPEAVNKPVGSFFLFDLCIPALRSFVGTVLISGGKNISNNVGNGVFASGKKSYDAYYNGNVKYLNTPQSSQYRSKIYDGQQIWYSTDEKETGLLKGQRVVDKMNDVLQRYPVVSVADLKEFSKLSDEIVPGDHHIGWDNIKDVKWYSDHGGYTFVYPPAMSID